MRPILSFLLAGAAGLSTTAWAQDAPAPSSSSPSAKPAPQNAQQGSADDDDDTQDIVVNGRAPPGAVIGDIPPENQLGPRAIASYGVGTISELLDQIALQTGSAAGDGAPVVLVNGRRISGVNEVSDLPTESVLRIDILPEEVALKYGYSAEQKVVNVILRRRFKSTVFNLDGGMSTAGGGGNYSGDATWTKIRDNDRLNIAARARLSDALFEDQRGVKPSATTTFDSIGNFVSPLGGEIDPALSALVGTPVTIAGVPATANPTLADVAALAGKPNVTDDSGYRTLSPSQQSYSVNAVFAHALSKKITTSFNLDAQYSTSASQVGLASGTLLLPAGNPFSPFAQTVGVARYFGTLPLTQDNESTSVQAGATVNVDFNPKWRLSIIGGYSYSESATLVDRGYDLSAYQAALDADDPTVSPYGPSSSSLLGPLLANHAHTTSDSGNASALLTGQLFPLPAGPMRISLRLGGTASSTSSVTIGATPVPELSLGRTTGDTMASLDFPLASKDFLRGLGTLTANFNVSRTLVSDFRTLDGYGYGLNWAPNKAISLIASVSESESAPGLQQLNSPTITTSNVRVFDYVNGTTATVTRTSGGNPDLSASDRRQLRLGATLKPFAKVDLSLSANFASSRARNIVGSFPGVSAALENAFPERFTRDEDGDLIAVDTRPVNFARQDEQQLRWGFTFTKVLRQPKRPAFNPRFRPPFPGQAGVPGGPATQGRPLGGPGVSGPPGGPPAANLDVQTGPPGPPTGADGGFAPPPGADGAPPPTTDLTGPGPASGQPPAAGGGDEIVVTGQTGSEGAAAAPRQRGFGGRGGFGGGRGQFGAGGFRGGGGFGGGGFGRGGGPGGGGGFGGGGGGPGRGGDNSSRLDITIYHTWIFEDRVLIRDGLPIVDLIHGGTLGGSATPRHRLEFNAGITDNGIGWRLTGQWQSGASVDGSTTTGTGTTGTGTLHFSSLATLNLRGFINLQQRLPKEKWARGVRLSVAISNVLDERQKVTDDTGATPIAYQSGYVDPLGRTVTFTIRKIF